MKDWYKRLLGLAISASLIALLLTKVVDMRAMVHIMASAKFAFLSLAFAVVLFTIFIQAYKWQVLLRAFSLSITFWETVSLFWSGMFFNLFLPSTIGGDVFRGYALVKYTGKAIDSTTSVLIDRVIGLVSLLLVATVASLIGYQAIDTLYVGPIIGVCFSLIIVFFVLSTNKNLAVRLRALARRAKLTRLGEAIREFNLSMNTCKNHKRVLLHVLLIGIIFQFLASLTGYLISLAIGISLPIPYFFIFIPVISIITLLPISINGLGVQDGAYVLLFTQIGISPSEAFSLSLLWHIIRVIISLPGGIISTTIIKAGSK